MKTNAVFLIITIVLLCISCGRKETEDVVYTRYQSLINTTEKQLIYVIETNVGYDTIQSIGHDSNNVVFYRKSTIETGFDLAWERWIAEVNVIQEMLFNLTDTSKYIPSNRGLVDCSEDDLIYYRHVSYFEDELSTAKNPILYFNLHFTDSIVQIMQKDYSMLDKFKEYYAK
ncbi:MAG: hypothetical protein LBR10_13630 [Prevotellaceae bacterium]|jgi:hypothetical protein|nr:hypothetical protein [Prevotellaceae bacterium]